MMNENNSESDSIERQLLDARHEKGVSLPDVHRATGVSASVLAGLESGAFDIVEPVFTRLALSAYVDYLGLDKQAILSQYDERCGAVMQRVPVDVVSPSPQPAPRATAALDVGALRVVAIAAGALVLLLLVIALVDDEEDRDTEEVARVMQQAVPVGARARPPVSAAASAEPAQTERDRPPTDVQLAQVPKSDADAEVQTAVEAESAERVAEVEAVIEATPVSDEETVAEVAPVMGEATTLENAPIAEAAGAADAEVEATIEALPASDGTVAFVAEGGAETGGSPDGEGTVLSAVVEGREQNAAVVEERGVLSDGLQAVDSGELVLQIEAIDSTWVQVKWDESGLFDAIVPPGSVHRWQARDAFIVHSGRAHGLRYTFQGELLGKGALGEATKVLRFRADSSGVVLLDRQFQPLSSDAQP